MFECEECGKRFEEPKKKQITFEEFYGVSNLFESRHRTSINVCPGCESEDIKEIEEDLEEEI